MIKPTPLFLGVLLLISLSSFVCASQQNIGFVKVGECVNLVQTCSNCTFVNVTKVIDSHKNNALGNVLMTKIGTDYNYTFCNNSHMGEYTYVTLGDPDGVWVTEPVTYQVNETGEDINGLSSLGIIIACIIIAGLLFFVSTLFAKEQKGIKTLLIMFGIGFILLTMQIAKSSIPGLEKIMNAGLIMGLILFAFMLAYFMIMYTKDIFIKLRNSWKNKQANSFGEAVQ